MSLSAAAIDKNHVFLSKLITNWLKDNPHLDPTPELASEVENKPDEPKQVVTVALRTRPFLENEAVDGKGLLPGVHARGQNMFAHVPSSKWNGPTIQHKPFGEDFSFGPESSSEHVYESLVIKPDVWSDRIRKDVYDIIPRRYHLPQYFHHSSVLRIFSLSEFTSTTKRCIHGWH
ncbi:hypothetical protein RSAG8_05812, partial [Rhizoctonia solani AG-8 WAC10335]